MKVPPSGPPRRPNRPAQIPRSSAVCPPGRKGRAGTDEHPVGNFGLPAYPGSLVKDSYWRWPENGRAGSAIDFFMRVLGLSFHDAMRQITGTSSHPPPAAGVVALRRQFSCPTGKSGKSAHYDASVVVGQDHHAGRAL
jgi:hypothetical protein